MEEEGCGGEVPLPSSISDICKVATYSNLQYDILPSGINELETYFQVCPSPRPAGVGGVACALLLPPRGGLGRGEGCSLWALVLMFGELMSLWGTNVLRGANVL